MKRRDTKAEDQRAHLIRAKHGVNSDPMMKRVMQVMGGADDPAEIQLYGYEPSDDPAVSQLNYEFMSFMDYLGLEEAGVTRVTNLKNIISICWPKAIITEWTDRMLESLANYNFVGWAGCAASGKTYTAAMYAVAWWLCDPENSTVIMTSTTKQMIRRRMWSPVQQLYMTWSLGERPGNMVDSRTVWQATKGDDKHGIFALAVKDGETASSVAHIQGIHSPRVLMVIDEATDTPQAIFDSINNIYAGAQQFQMLVIGNPNSKYDPHGKFCEPKSGWGAVSITDDEWETTPKFNQAGIMLRFDGAKSPNMLYDEVKYPFLVTRKTYEDAHKQLGENSPWFWKFWRGFWAPTGLVQTVLDETTITMQEADKFFEFMQIIAKVAHCDPAFGGGDCAIFRVSTLGMLENGKIGLQMGPPEEIELDASIGRPVHYQLSDYCMRRCMEERIPPHMFGMDETGEGGGTCDILAQEWSPAIQRVCFGGLPSEQTVSNEDLRPAKEVYDRRVTELWFRLATMVKNGQVRGLDEDCIRELTTRTWEIKTRKMRIQTKKEMKEVYGRSPDYADNAVIGIEVAFRNGMFQSGIGTAAEKEEHFEPEEDPYSIYTEETGSEREEVDYEYAVA